MKLKNINISLLVLSGLLVLSFAFFVVAQEKSSSVGSVFLDSDQDGLTDSEEKLYGTDAHNPDSDGDGYKDGTEVQAGYDPLKPAPGDKLSGGEVKEKTEAAVQGVETSEPQENLTQSLAQKISALAADPNADNQNFSMDQINELIDSSLSEQSANDGMPEISEKDIIIKKQNYGNLSEAKAKEKMKEDFTDYLASVLYILASNSPKPLTSADDINSVISQITQQITTALSLRNSKSLEDLKKSGEKITEQLKEVEVPQDLVEIHIKALQYSQQMITLQSLIDPNLEDPIANMVNYSKLQTFVGSLFDFYQTVQNKIDEYGIQYNDIQDKIKKYGIDLPDLDAATNTEATSTTDTDTTNTTLDNNATSLINE